MLLDWATARPHAHVLTHASVNEYAFAYVGVSECSVAGLCFVCVVDILADASLRKLLKHSHFLFEAVVKGNPHLCKHTR